MEFEIGQAVTWSSQSAGSHKVKIGTVEKVVHSNTNPKHPELRGPGGRRDHVSYLVRVPGKTKKSAGKIYWPRVSALKAA